MKGVLVGFLTALWAASPARGETIVNACCQSWTGPAVLAADLDCSAAPCSPGVTLAGGRFDLAGFTLTGPDADGAVAVRCDRSCRLLGPGTIVGTVGQGYDARSVGVFDLAMVSHDPDTFDEGPAISASRVKLVGVTISGFRSGVYADTNPGGRVKLVDSALTGNGEAASGFNDGYGVKCYRCSALQTTISGYGEGGILGSRIKLVDSSVTNNDSACVTGCGGWCADLRTVTLPKIRSSTCGTSRSGFDCETWGVCAND